MNDEIDALSDAYNNALELEKAGNIDQAAALYRQCLALDPTDMCGASVRLASLGLADAPIKAPDAYVEMLFDQHAEDFDDILTGSLGYAVPMQVAEILNATAPGPYQRMLDLGCGTGLSGMMLQENCIHATGVDISENMVDKADERACYDELYVNEAVHFLEEWAKREDPAQQPFDLLVATDVLPYFGALEPLFKGLAANASDNATIVLSIETMDDDAMQGKDWHITPNHRYAHAAAYLENLCKASGFNNITHFETIVVRSERDMPIPGYLVIANKGLGAGPIRA